MISIKTDELLYALDDASLDINYYLDIRSGRIIEIFANDLIDEIENSTPEDFYINRKYYLPIRSNRLGILLKIIQSFILQIENLNIRREFMQVFESTDEFRLFKRLLARYPRLRHRWFNYYPVKMAGYARKWLENHNITADFC